METIVFNTSGTCARSITFERDAENRIHHIQFEGGCNGNLKALAILCEGMKADEIAEKLKGNVCGRKATSCADQLAKAVISKAEE